MSIRDCFDANVGFGSMPKQFVHTEASAIGTTRPGLELWFGFGLVLGLGLGFLQGVFPALIEIREGDPCLVHCDNGPGIR